MGLTTPARQLDATDWIPGAFTPELLDWAIGEHEAVLNCEPLGITLRVDQAEELLISLGTWAPEWHTGFDLGTYKGIAVRVRG